MLFFFYKASYTNITSKIHKTVQRIFIILPTSLNVRTNFSCDKHKLRTKIHVPYFQNVKPLILYFFFLFFLTAEKFDKIDIEMLAYSIVNEIIYHVTNESYI